MFPLIVSIFAFADPPVITIDRDNVEITESCVIQIAADHIVDADGNGVIHIARGGVTVDFNNQNLHGAKPDQLPDAFSGIGVKITAHDVTLKNASISGFKVGIHALNADGLTIHTCDVSNNFHQRLKSTPAAEDGSDWLWPHNNDNNEWMTNYGAGICVEDSNNVTLHDIRARQTQNGIILDRVDDSRVYDCDCSFLSGWGLAMWRSNRNIISRNAFDFCVRGYSHGVYNRGQDSAGILMFEQCSENMIAENSVTHGGDGVFAFAGKEALGENGGNGVSPVREPDWYKGRGCNDNQFYRNDFSYAAAHGLELTFSFDNRIWENTFTANAICGIWGGYSQRTAIHQNVFRENGAMAYGQERGGINIEHGVQNHIFLNEFHANKCSVFLWDDEDASIMSTPWAQVNDARCKRNSVEQNKFNGDAIAIQLRLADQTRIFNNKCIDVSREIDACDKSNASLIRSGAPIHLRELHPKILGETRPVGARKNLAGRENIIMTEWGPWDHESPLLQFVGNFDHADEYILRGTKRIPTAAELKIEGNVIVDLPNASYWVDTDSSGKTRIVTHRSFEAEGDRFSPEELMTDEPIKVRISSRGGKDRFMPYAVAFSVEGHTLPAKGALTGGSWDVWTFKSVCDPREDVERWQRTGEAEHHTTIAEPLDLRFGNRGLSELAGLPVPLPRDHFGVIATRSLTLPRGKWRVKTTSDDGIRVWMNDDLIIDDWTWHAPKRNDFEFTLEEEKTIQWRVEYFELDGYAVLSVDIEPIAVR